MGSIIGIYETITGDVFLLLTGAAQPHMRDKMQSFLTHVFLP
jgi:hypothetical protein